MLKTVFLEDTTGELSARTVAAAASFVPTRILAAATFTITDNAQALMVRPIVLDAGARIVIGENSSLVSS